LHQPVLAGAVEDRQQPGKKLSNILTYHFPPVFSLISILTLS
jgi:hypothetical protein